MTTLPSKSQLLHALKSRRRYHDSPSWMKPFIEPARFLRNQRWKRTTLKGQAGEPQKIQAFHMEGMFVVAGENISNQLACYGFMEPDLTEAFIHLIEPGQTVLDIGMHIGYFTVLFAILTGETGEVHSFEPTISTYQFAHGNTSQFQWIHSHPCALWSERTQMEFQDFGLQWMAFNSLGEARIPDSVAKPKKITVPCETLDSCRHLWKNKVDLIKIDAESAEKAILTGGKELIAKDQPIITLEMGDENQQSGTSRELIDFMVQLDYRPWEFKDGRLNRHTLLDRYDYTNLIFAPKNRDLL